MTDQGEDRVIPIFQEEAFVDKRLVATEHVRVRTSFDEDAVSVRDTVDREHVEISRVPIGHRVERAPPIRQEGDVTVVPVLEERLVVEKQLFLVEEIHLRRSTRAEPVELETSVRRTRVDIEREDLTNRQE